MLSVVLFSMRGGVETYTLQLANALSSIARVGYVIDFNKRRQLAKGIDRRVVLLEYKRPRRRELLGVFEIKRIAREIEQFKPDLLHLQGDGVWEGILLRFLANIPVVNTVHDPIKHVDQRTWLNNWTMRDAIKRSCGYVVHGEELKKIFVEKNKINDAKILVHPHGVYNYYCNYCVPSRNRKKNLLFFGALRKNKGVDLFLEAFVRVKDEIPDWNVVVAGLGSLEQNVFFEANQERITSYNRYITDAEAAYFFASAGVVVLPYRHGSQSGVLALAAAFDCPVLATRVGNIPEMLRSRRDALLVEPSSVEALAGGVLEITKNDQLRMTLGENLGKLARSEWSWDDIAAKTLQFYRECI